MANPAFRRASLCTVLAFAVTSFSLQAGGPATPGPKVAATIEQSANAPASCIVMVEVRDPQSDELLVAPKFVVAAGEAASASGSDSDRKFEVNVKAGPGCAGGTYSVNVLTSGKLTLTKSGALRPKAR